METLIACLILVVASGVTGVIIALLAIHGELKKLNARPQRESKP